MSVSDKNYRVVGVERDRLWLRRVHSGDVLSVLNSEPETPLTQDNYPLGKVIALTDPSSAPLNSGGESGVCIGDIMGSLWAFCTGSALAGSSLAFAGSGVRMRE